MYCKEEVTIHSDQSTVWVHSLNSCPWCIRNKILFVQSLECLKAIRNYEKYIFFTSLSVQKCFKSSSWIIFLSEYGRRIQRCRPVPFHPGMIQYQVSATYQSYPHNHIHTHTHTITNCLISNYTIKRQKTLPAYPLLKKLEQSTIRAEANNIFSCS